MKVSSQDLSKQENILYSSINDGPYVFIESNKLIQKTIVSGKVFTDTINTSLYNTSFSPNKEIYKNVRKIAALSDIHGQYDLAVEILKNNKIIDKNLNWCFGTGHLVVVGDIFDRGDKVNEMLLLVYKLEQEAKRKGGRVHLLLGNHEYMVLHKDLRYLNNKYKITCRLLNVDYDELYGKQTVLGRWLRSKPTIIKLNNTIFVHGGISKEFLSQNDFNIETINNLMRASIERDKTEMRSSGFYETFYGGNGLIWYRGYFYGGLDDMDISQILNITKSEHIVVGHCSNDRVVSLFDNKIFGVDSSIKKGKYGELLFVKNDKYYRKTLKGTKERFGNK
ncbi:metallophosphoesterase [Litoribaculum gwangyangense]|uniref:Metallophosphoesterase n=1 Tax=Litoribaculum gwangyangense TaxID=1130722 RepID=A0ABP9BZ22_9FLAO